MEFNERLKYEQTNTSGDIVMYEDGSEFIKAFERSAFMLCRCFKPMEPLVYNNKEYGGMYVKVGYSKKSVARYTSHPDYDYSKKDDNGVIIHRLTRKQGMEFPEEDFSRWKEKAIADKREKKDREKADATGTRNADAVVPEQVSPSASSWEKLLISDIMAQQLSNYTPMMALNYLNSLQERIRNERLSD